MKRNYFTWNYFRKLLLIILGSFILALAVNNFLVPNHLLSGGFTGIAILFYYFLGWPTGISLFILNIPVFILGSKYVSPRFAVFSLLAMSLFSFFIELTKTPVIQLNDVLLAAIFGGILNGLGIGLVFQGRASFGGTDIIAIIGNKYSSLSIGSILLSANILILLVYAVSFDIKMALYTMIGMYTSSKLIDYVQEGINHRKSVIIVSDQAAALSESILRRLKRGVTFLHGEGAYTHNQKEIIYCIVKTRELPKLKDIIIEIDPKAFMSVSDTKEVLGKGFYQEGFK